MVIMETDSAQNIFLKLWSIFLRPLLMLLEHLKSQSELYCYKLLTA